MDAAPLLIPRSRPRPHITIIRTVLIAIAAYAIAVLITVVRLYGADESTPIFFLLGLLVFPLGFSELIFLAIPVLNRVTDYPVLSPLVLLFMGAWYLLYPGLVIALVTSTSRRRTIIMAVAFLLVLSINAAACQPIDFSCRSFIAGC